MGVKIITEFSIKSETHLRKVNGETVVEGQITYPNIVASSIPEEKIYDENGTPTMLAYSLHRIVAQHMLISLIRTASYYGLDEAKELRELIKYLETEFANPDIVTNGTKVTKGTKPEEW